MDSPTKHVIVQTTEVEVATKADIAVVNAKLSSLKAWGVAALVGGQVIAGFLASIIGPRETVEQVAALARASGLI